MTHESLTTIYKVRNPVTDGIPIWNFVVACLPGTVFLKQLELLWQCLLCLSGGTWVCGLQLSYTSSPSLLYFPHVVWFEHMLHLELGHENLAHSCSVTCWGRHMTQVGPIRVKAYFKCYRKRSACFFLGLARQVLGAAIGHEEQEELSSPGKGSLWSSRPWGRQSWRRVFRSLGPKHAFYSGWAFLLY